MNWIKIENTIEGDMFVNMSNVKTIHKGEEQNHFCIYLDREAFPFLNKEQRDKELRSVLSFIGNYMFF